MDEIENRVSIWIKLETSAQWGIKKFIPYIALGLAGCWREAVEIVDQWRGYPCEDEHSACYGKYIESFCDTLACSYLIERICLERYNQRIRLKRDHCKPCCVNPIALAMHNHVSNSVTYQSIKEET